MRAWPALVALSIALSTGLGCRGDDQQSGAPATRPSDVVLELDEIKVTRGELAEWYPYLDALDPKLGRAFRDREILDQQVLPLKFARRWFAQQRDDLRRAATALINLAPTLAELEDRSRSAEDKNRRGFAFERPVLRIDLQLAIGRAAFDADRLGQVQGPIETPYGFAIVGTRRIDKGLTKYQDRADPWLVYYNNHESKAAFDAWWDSVRKTARTRVTFVHPDLKDSLPLWMQP